MKNQKCQKIQCYSKDILGKLLFMRHGETYFNADKRKNHRKVNKNYIDCKLNPKGIDQAKSKQEILNKLSFEKIYVSPFYRALQTLTYSLENHPNKDNIIAVVNPLIGETSNCINDYILDIKQTKKDFNMNSPIKIDWSYFDEYVKGIKYDENFYYFENFDCLEDSAKDKIYQKLRTIYESNNIEELKIGLTELAKLRVQNRKRFESLKCLQERFKKFCQNVKNEYKESLGNDDKKILAFSHCSYMKVGTDIRLYSGEKQYFNIDCYKPKNCEILSYNLLLI
jgi:broad specificity phosphatase PhoE